MKPGAIDNRREYRIRLTGRYYAGAQSALRFVIPDSG